MGDDLSSDKKKDILLRAAFELLLRQDRSNIVLNLLDETVFFHGAECDGYCLMEDIAEELGIGMAEARYGKAKKGTRP